MIRSCFLFWLYHWVSWIGLFIHFFYIRIVFGDERASQSLQKEIIGMDRIFEFLPCISIILIVIVWDRCCIWYPILQKTEAQGFSDFPTHVARMWQSRIQSGLGLGTSSSGASPPPPCLPGGTHSPGSVLGAPHLPWAVWWECVPGKQSSWEVTTPSNRGNGLSPWWLLSTTVLKEELVFQSLGFLLWKINLIFSLLKTYKES